MRCIYWNFGGLFCAGIALYQILSSIIGLVLFYYAPLTELGAFGWTSLLIMLCIGAVILWSFFKTMLCDPGYVDMGDPLTPEKYQECAKSHYRICSHCMSLKPIRSHHCRTCGRYVMKMDHHCPWVNNCIGLYNQKYFLLFLAYYSIGECFPVFFGLKWGIWMYKNRLYVLASIFLRRARYYLFCFLFFNFTLSVIFVIFGVSLLVDQLHGIRYDVTGVERLSDPVYENRRFFSQLEWIMGEPFGWRWFFPVAGRSLSRQMQVLCDDCILIYEDEEPFMEETVSEENSDKLKTD